MSELDDLSRLRLGIERPLVCSQCADEVERGDAGATSLAEYGRLDVGFSAIGLQVWCRRHGTNVVHIDFSGHDLPTDFRALLPRKRRDAN